jgi:7-cyano-7-deazaguanine synthase
MDSCVTAALAARETDAYGLHFSYGQRTEARELTAARSVAVRLGLKDFLHLRIDLFRAIGGSALTDSKIAVRDTEANSDGSPSGGSSPAETQ